MPRHEVGSWYKTAKKNTNIYRDVLYQMFPNLERITLDVRSGYPVDPLSLLDILDDPACSLQSVCIRYGYGEKWTVDGFDNIETVQRYKDKGIEIEGIRNGIVLYIK